MKALCDALDVPILAPEMMMNDIDLQAQWLISGATDMIRANARHGTTAILKLAHLAEMHGSNIELNGYGGLYGLVHAHLLAAISNTSYYETFGEFRGHTERSSTEIGMLNPLDVVDGHVAPPSGPGWGAEWDWTYFNKQVVESSSALWVSAPSPSTGEGWGEGDGWRRRPPCTSATGRAPHSVGAGFKPPSPRETLQLLLEVVPARASLVPLGHPELPVPQLDVEARRLERHRVDHTETQPSSLPRSSTHSISRRPSPLDR